MNTRTCGQICAGTALFRAVPDTQIFLPGGLAHPGDLALVGQLAETDPADAVIPEVGVGAAAQLTAVVAAAGELGLALLLQYH